MSQLDNTIIRQIENTNRQLKNTNNLRYFTEDVQGIIEIKTEHGWKANSYFRANT